MKKQIALGFVTLLCASIALGKPLDLGRAIVAAASEEKSVREPIAKTFDKGLPGQSSFDKVIAFLFEHISAVGATLPYLNSANVKDAIVASMEAAATSAKAIGALPESEDLDASDTLGTCYSTAIAALLNAVPEEVVRKATLQIIFDIIKAPYDEQAKAVAENPEDYLGRVNAYAGSAIANEVRENIKPSTTTDRDHNEEFLTTQTLTTTTTTTTTTSTTQGVIKLNDTIVDPGTLKPVPDPGATTSTTRPHESDVIDVVVPTTRPSPTPVGLR